MNADGADWPQARWANILDRIDHRQSYVGLRYWGPPIWLEVTMTGPDADLWPASTDDTLSWDWQSSDPCTEAMDLAAAGADDDCLVAAVGRYTIENLILNAVHEIGEWLRFDGHRVIHAHPSGTALFREPLGQGNGAVDVRVTFEPADQLTGEVADDRALDEVTGRRLVSRLARFAAATRYTCVAGTTISYEAAGPVVRSRADDEAVTVWRGTWSRSTLEAARVDAEDFLDLAQRDVHAALIWSETDRICRAFHIDGRRPWRLAGPAGSGVADLPEAGPSGASVLAISIDYARGAGLAASSAAGWTTDDGHGDSDVLTEGCIKWERSQHRRASRRSRHGH